MTKEVEKARDELLKAFPGSFVNQTDELIAHPGTNQYIIIRDCETLDDVKAKVLEWFSRPAHKTAPYRSEWRNKKFHAFMLDGVNKFLGKNFTEDDMDVIYTWLGNRVNHRLTMEFIAHDMDVGWLKERLSAFGEVLP